MMNVRRRDAEHCGRSRDPNADVGKAKLLV